MTYPRTILSRIFGAPDPAAGLTPTYPVPTICVAFLPLELLMNCQRLNHIVRVSALGLLVAAGGLSLTGCKSDTPDSVHLNPSPELFTRAKTYDQNMANFALTLDRDARSAIDDFQRVFLINRASRMNKSPNPW